MESGERPQTTWTLWLSVSTAIVAVLAAVASLEAGAWANEALVCKNDAILHQSKADDGWAYYQAKSVKAAIYATQAELTLRPDLAAKWNGEAERERNEQRDIKTEAEREQALVKEMNETSEHRLHQHHQFARSVTIFQVSIALAAIAALTRRKVTWWVSLGVGAAGAAFFVVGILHA